MLIKSGRQEISRTQEWRMGAAADQPPDSDFRQKVRASILPGERSVVQSQHPCRDHAAWRRLDLQGVHAGGVLSVVNL